MRCSFVFTCEYKFTTMDSEYFSKSFKFAKDVFARIKLGKFIAFK